MPPSSPSPTHDAPDERWTDAFVGRDHELAEVLELLERSRDGVAVCLLAGDAGMGKTRLARELEAHAVERGHRVVWGLGWADTGSPPYWPWTQVVRQLLGRRSGTDLAALVLAEGAAADRAELFDATAAIIEQAAARRPLVVVLDDLHVADPPTIALLGFVATHLREVPLLVVATIRDREVRRRAELADALGRLDRHATTITLAGLDVTAVGRLVGSRSRARDLHAATGGNPMFLEQVQRGDIDTADTLVSVLQTRVAQLPPEVARTVATAALVGPDPAPDALATVLDLPVQIVQEHLATAAAHGLFDRTDARPAHPLTADAALRSLADGDREALHAAAADRLPSASPADRAHHLLHAGPARWRDAVDACAQAADAARVSHAHEDAVGHLRRAVELAQHHEAGAAVLADLTLALAGSVVEASGRADAEDLYLSAWALAEATDDPWLIGRAGARHGTQYYFAGDITHAVAANARVALDRLGDGDTELHARLHATLAAASIVEAPVDAVDHAGRAVQIARRCGDPAATAAALVAEQVADLGPATLFRRLETAREIIALAEEARTPDLAVHGRFLLMGALLERGEVGELDAQLRQQDARIDEFASPRFARHALWFRCTRAMLDGDADAVEALADECFEIADRLGDPDGIAVFGAQYGVARWMRGLVLEMEGAYVDSARADPDEPVWRGVLAWLWGTHGRLDEARGALDLVPPATELASGQYTLLTLVTAADAALAVDDPDRAAELWEALLPYADRVVPIAMGAACWGTVAHRLGALALRLGHVEEGVAHLEQAISLCARLGARPWLAEAQLSLADALLDTGHPAPGRVQQLVSEAAATAAALGLGALDAQLDAVQARLDGRPAAGSKEPVARAEPALVVAAPARPRLAVLGTFEVLAADGSTPRWTSRKARQLLKILIARRGAPIARDHVMHLLWPDQEPELLRNRLSVALSTVRRALDPARSSPASRFVAAESDTLRLVLAHVDLDTEEFLAAAQRAIDAHRAGDPGAPTALREAIDRHGGDPLPDEPYAEWAEPLRREVTGLLLTTLRCHAESTVATGDHVGAAATFRRLLEVDPYDEPAHLGLVETLRSLGAHGQAEAARRRYLDAMAELGLPTGG
ncbi:AAA family ATPase [Acidimicrobiia bacterium EGI L10123]|uniref:AAA family ATPase n=1 Tax=Salinilacustrithrix flava TaxID=2957203 RepID=UPI003D7C2DA8|nr:AAA family ATPase [Acidimicrobiia bacterium EGI L10123]